MGMMPGLRKKINEKSEFMRNRTGNMVFDVRREIDKLTDKSSKVGQARNWLLDNAYFLQNLTQGFVDKAVWWAAYNKGLAQNMTEESAVRYADETIQETQGSYQVSQLAAIERSGALGRLLTMFSRFSIMRHNLLKQEYHRITGGEKFSPTKHSIAILNTALFVLLLPEVFAAALSVYVFGRASDDDDEEEQMKQFAATAGGMAITGTVPILGGYTQGGVSKLLGKDWSPPTRATPAAGMVDDMFRVIEGYKKILDEDEEVEPWDAMLVYLKTAGLIVPMRPLENLISGQAAIEAGEVDSEDALRAYITGG